MLEIIVALSALISFDKSDFSSEIKALTGGSKHLCAQAIIAHSNHTDTKRSSISLNDLDRLRLRIWLEVLICEIYGLTASEVEYILRDCSFSAAALMRRRRLTRVSEIVFSADQQPAEPEQRSFFRVDKELAPHLRLPNLVKSSFAGLKELQPDFIATLLEDFSRQGTYFALPAAVEHCLVERLQQRGKKSSSPNHAR